MEVIHRSPLTRFLFPRKKASRDFAGGSGVYLDFCEKMGTETLDFQLVWLQHFLTKSTRICTSIPLTWAQQQVMGIATPPKKGNKGAK